MAVRTGKDLQCKQCNALFYVPAWRMKDPRRGKFCSKQCSGTYRSVHYIGKDAAHWQGGITLTTFECGYCQEPYEARYRRTYCSRECLDNMNRHRRGQLHHSWTGGLPSCTDCGKKLANYGTSYCMSCAKVGERAYNWKGNPRYINKRIRSRSEYVAWRKAVFERDDYTCRNCSVRGGTLQADHILPFALFPSLRHDPSNGQTLCIECHKSKTKADFKLYDFWRTSYERA